MIALLEKIDHRVFFFINNSWSSGLMDDIFVPLTHMGSWPVLFVTAALLAGVGRKKFALHFGVLLVTGVILVQVVLQSKRVIDRDRPLKVFRDEIYSGAVYVNTPDLAAPMNKAIPSGHSTMAFFALAYPVFVRRRWALPLLLLATLIAVSRVYVAAHFPLDCLIGGALGTAWAAGAATIYFLLERRIWRPETTA